MTLPVPNLDDRTYADLLAEAEGLIPTYAPAWTNRNASDPGITLLELFAWLAEMLIYRANQVPDRHVAVFLRLLNPDWKPSADRPLEDDVRATVQELRRRYRAVTAEDYEALAREAPADVARAHCLPRRYLGAQTEQERLAEQPGWMSVIVVPRESVEDEAAVWATVSEYLEPRRLLATRHVVVGPVWAPVGAEILAARRADFPHAEVRRAIVHALRRFLDPLTGGPDAAGWPFGRSVYASELYRVLEEVPGVDYVPDLHLVSECGSDDARCAPAKELWNEEGDQLGLGLAPHHLPRAALDRHQILTSADFVAVQVSVAAAPVESASPATIRRAAKSAVRKFFHPHYGKQDLSADWTVDKHALLRSVGRRLAHTATVKRIDVCAPGHEKTDDSPVQLKAGQIADLRVDVEVE